MNYLVYITAPNKGEAEKIGAFLIEGHLAACVNIFDGITSIYRWEGEIQKDGEVVLIAKTTYNKFGELKDKVKEIHPYDCPCITAIEIKDGNEEFLSWIESETS